MTDTTTPQATVAALRELLAAAVAVEQAATKGPWSKQEDREIHGWIKLVGLPGRIGYPTIATDLGSHDYRERHANFDFIAAARTSVPADHALHAALLTMVEGDLLTDHAVRGHTKNRDDGGTGSRTSAEHLARHDAALQILQLLCVRYGVEVRW